MEFLYLLESIRIPVLNEFMLAVTYLGDEIAFLVTALILMWCADKKSGYYVLSVDLYCRWKCFCTGRYHHQW